MTAVRKPRPADDPRKLRLGDAFARFHRPDLDGRVSRKTLDTYREVLAAWQRHTDDPPIGRINNATLAKFRDAYAAGRSPATVNRAWRHLRAIFRRLGPAETGNPLGESILSRTPYMAPLREQRRIPRMVSNADLDAVYRAAGSMSWPAFADAPPADWWRAWLALAVGCGPRIGDLLRLRPADVDARGRLLRYRAQKTGTPLEIPLGDVVLAHLRRIGGTRPRLFLTSETASLSMPLFYRAWSDLLDRARVRRRFTPHDLRRTCGSLYFRVGGYELAAYVLGHAQRSVTMSYYVDPREAARDAADAIDWPPAFREILSDPDREKSVVEERRRRQRRNWSFGVGTAAYRGRSFRLTPRRHALLRAFVAAGRPLSFDDLRAAAWPDRPQAGKVVIKVTVCALRDQLAEVFGVPGWEPLPYDHAAGGWRLNTPPEPVT